VGRLIDEVRDRALTRPWLLVPPLLGLLGQNLLSLVAPGAPGAVMAGVLLGALMTVAVTALFAELWIGDGRSVDFARLARTAVVFLIPYPLLFVFGLLTTPLAYSLLRADIPQSASTAGLYLILAAGKLTAFALGAVSSIAAARRLESSGALGALLLGTRALASNAGFFLVLLIGFWLFQEACVILTRALAPGLLDRFFTTVIPLFACVAFPIEAWRSGRLKT
jgi:hypothetical protein